MPRLGSSRHVVLGAFLDVFLLILAFVDKLLGVVLGLRHNDPTAAMTPLIASLLLRVLSHRTAHTLAILGYSRLEARPRSLDLAEMLAAGTFLASAASVRQMLGPGLLLGEDPAGHLSEGLLGAGVVITH